MYYTNRFTLATNSNESAEKAFEIIKNRLASGFECDNSYKHSPSSLLMEGLFVENSNITVPDEFSCSSPEDSERVFNELLKALHERFDEDFTCEIYNYTDDDESEVSAICKNGSLKITETYFPNGYCESVYCAECDTEIRFNIYNPNEHIVCPDCGEEVDISDYLAVVTEYNY